MSIAVIANLAIFVGILLFLFLQQRKANNSLSRQVLLGLVFGSVFGLLVHVFMVKVIQSSNKLLNG